MAQVFISYAQEDSNTATDIALGLEKARYSSWYYENSSVPGPHYLDQTQEAIEQCQAFLLIISQDSLSSHQVDAEISHAFDVNKPFIPILKNISFDEFQRRRPRWKMALRAAAALTIPANGVSALLSRIIGGLQKLNIEPSHVKKRQSVIKELRCFTGHKSKVNSVSISPDDRFILSGSSDRTMRLWNVRSGKEKHCFQDTNAIYTTAFSPDGHLVASGGVGGGIQLWDVSSGEILNWFSAHSVLVNSVVFYHEDRRIITGGNNKTLRVWDVRTGEAIGRFKRHESGVNCVALSADGRYVLSGGMDHTTRMWNVKSKKEKICFDEHRGAVLSVAISPDVSKALSGSSDKTLRLWDVKTGEEICSLGEPRSQVRSVAISPDGRFALSGHRDGIVRLWSLEAGQEIRSLKGHQSAVNCVAFSSKGHYAVTGSSDKTVRLWKLPNMKPSFEETADRINQNSI
jgi:WD40 repeat protein